MPTVTEKQDEKYGNHDDLGMSDADRSKEVADLERDYAAPSYSGKELQNKESAADAPGISKAANKEQSQLDSQSDGLFNPNKDKGGLRQFGKSLFNSRKNRTLMGGGLVGMGVGGVMFAYLGILSGPLQIIHIGEILKDAHFSHQEDAGDSRVSKFYRFMRSNGSVGETRLGYLQSKYHARLVTKLGDIGITPNYNGLDHYKGLTIDLEHENSPYKGKSAQEVASEYERNGVKTTINGNKITFEADGYFAQKGTTKTMVRALGNSKLTTGIRARPLQKFGLVTWHPMKIVDKKVNAAISDRYKTWKEERDNRIKNGSSGQVKAPDGSTNTSEEAKTKFQEIAESKGVKVTGGLAAAAGLVCMVKAVDDNIDNIRYADVIAPMIRLAMDAVTQGDQIRNGNSDVDPEEMGFISKSFDELDKDGNVKTSWINATSVASYSGEKGTEDIDPGIKEIMKGGHPGYISWVNHVPGVDTMCGTVGQIVVGGASVVIGLISGGLVSTLTGVAVGFVAGPWVIDSLSGLVAGDSVDPDATGAKWGNYIMHGGRLAANTVALMYGGIGLSAAQVGALDKDSQESRKEDFQKQSLLARLFNTKDYQSLAGRAIDKAPSNPDAMVASLVHTATPLNAITSLGSILPKAKAADTTYDYGFPEYGFSKTDLDNPDTNNPYDNADDVASILDGSSGQGYIDQAKECFGVIIEKDSGGLWAAIPDTSTGKPVNPYAADYDKAKCTGESDATWRKIRMFIFDSATMDALMCYESDDAESCDNASGNRQGSAASDETIDQDNSGLLKTGTLCTINDKSLNEASGLAASLKHPGIVYTHNDEKGPIFAINISDCSVAGKFTVNGLRKDPDPEAITIDHTTGKIWFGDIGNGHPDQPFSDKKQALKYPNLAARIVVFDEPSSLNGGVSNAQTYDITYQGGNQNSEALLVNPKTGQGYIISKGPQSKVFQLPNPIRSGQATDTGVRIPNWVTDATFTNDGKYILVRYRTASDASPTNVYVYDANWKKVGDITVPKMQQGESITMDQDSPSFILGSEGTNSPLVRVALPEQFGGAPPASTTTPGGTTSGNTKGKLALTNWKITLPTGKEIKQPQLATYSDKWYHPAADGSGQEFYVDSGDKSIGTTTHSSNPRSELREMTSGGKSNASWSSNSGDHRMLIRQKVTELSGRGHVVVGQIHDDQDDISVFRLEKDQLWITNGDTTHGKLLGTIKLKQPFTVGFDVSGGIIRYYFSPTGDPNPKTVSYTQSKTFGGAYFKAGNYYQGGTDGGKSRVVIMGLGVTHNNTMPVIADLGQTIAGRMSFISTAVSNVLTSYRAITLPSTYTFDPRLGALV